MNNEKEIIKILPAVKYHLKDFMHSQNIIIEYNEFDNLVGFDPFYSMDALVNGVNDKLLLNVRKKDDTYLINVRSLSRIIPNSVLSVNVKGETIDIESKILFEKDTSKNTYFISNDLSKKKKILLKKTTTIK